MKRLITLPAAFLSSIILLAATVDKNTAQKKAVLVLGKPVVEVEASAVEARNSVDLENSDEDEAYYLFNAEDGKGFVIVAAEDNMGDVLGYSDNGHLASDQMLPDALVFFLEGFKQATNDYRNGKLQAPLYSAPLRSSEAGPLVSTTWNQTAPYNNLCPIDKNVHSAAGCVAIALAQVLKYWNWPVKGVGYGNGTCGGEVVHGTLEHTYQWDAMMNTTSENLQSETASAAVAQLVYDCGLSVGMNYSANGSSAPSLGSIVKVLYQNFGYVPTTLRAYSRASFESDEEWLQLIFNEIDNKRPVIFSANSQTGSGRDAAGHSFVVDGYNSNSFLHVNWGWGGSSDGYYSVALMNPGSYSFIINQSAVVGIQPAKNGETGVPDERPFVGTAPTCDRSGTIAKSIDFVITIGNICNFTSSHHTWSVSIGIYDVNNNMLGEAKQRGGTAYAINLDPDYFTTVLYDITCNLSTKKLANGHYALRVMFKENGDWILPDMAGGQKNNAIYIEVANNKITFTDGTAYNAALKAGIMPVITTQPLEEDGCLYDLQGRKVSTSSKGIFIQNGHKVVR